MHLLFVFERYQKFLMHLEKKYVSEISDTYQNFMIHIKILWYISEISDTYQKFLIHISFFWYISEISDTYKNFMIHIKILWYISEISDTYQKFLIHIRFFWYISEMSDIYFLWYISKIYDTYQKFLIHMFLDVKTWLVSEFLIHTSLGDTICVKKFQIEWFWKLFSNFFTHIVHIHHVCTSCFSNMSWTIKQHASTSHLHMHFKTNLLSTQIPVKVGDFAQCMC